MSQNFDLNKLIPSYLRNEVLTSLVSNLFNRFVSQEQSVFTAGRIGQQIDGDATITEPDLERQENALIPGLFFEAGTEQYLFTFNDLINKINTLDIDVGNLRSWIAEQSFNYSPPINYDKFINYTNYYWVASSFTEGTGPSWNINYLPEYYVIARPKATDVIKMPVRLSTTPARGNINLYFNDRPTETFTLTFTGATSFTVSSNIDPYVASQNGTVTFTGGAGISSTITLRTFDHVTQPYPSLNNGPQVVDLCTFNITNGIATFQVGDTFTINIEYFTSNTTATLNSLSIIGKGTITGINSIYNGTSPQPMYIDNIAINVGDRILVKNQTDATENGIYIATAGGRWARTVDMADGQLYSNIIIYVEHGIAGGTTWTITPPVSPLTVNTDAFNFLPIFPRPDIPINEWQAHNYWIHKDDIALYTDLGYSISTSTQAQCPIIEYLDTLQLNGAIDNDGKPADKVSIAVNLLLGTLIAQTKTRFNQIPLFDLFRYDGTHANMTSGIWFYAESPNYTTNPILLRRVITTPNNDFVFGAGISDDTQRLLYWKNNNILENIWSPGVSSSTTSTPVFFGDTNKGTLTVTSIAVTADSQQWVVTAINPTHFNIVGSRSGLIGVATVGTAFTSIELGITISAGINPFSTDEYFKFNAYSTSSPRYIKQLNDGSIINFPGGYTTDHSSATPVGAWLTPARMFQNLNRETRNQIAFGDFINHGISVIAWQDQFAGSPFGNNNVRDLSFNPGYGGQIREFGSNFPLLASMLIEQDLSPLTIINFAEQQYHTALASIDQFLINNLATYFATIASIQTTSINPNATDIQKLLENFELARSIDTNLTTVFGDTTSSVKNWPATLPMIGLLPKVQPNISFDYELNSAVILHHDGHTTIIYQDDPTFDRTLVSTLVTRSDGIKTAGVFSEATPSMPYARQLWMKPSTLTTSIFDVDYDTVAAPTNATIGQYWYNRTSNILKIWNGTWASTITTVASRWIALSTASIRNSLILAIENKLYDGVHPQQQINVNLTATAVINSQYAQLELAQFSAEYNLDTYAPNYDPGNAFTWNYKQATITGLTPPTPARWYDIYKSYFNSFGSSVLSTDRPDIEPWKLMGFSNKPGSWDSTYAAPTYTSGGSITSVTYVTTTNITLTGLQIIDGVTISSGDRILVAGQSTLTANGIYIAGTGGWIRASDTITSTMNVNINGGYKWIGTVWTLNTTGSITIGITNLDFKQVRTWKSSMWVDIKAAHPTMKLCVNIATDGIIPPYVSSTQFPSSESLLTTIPNGINLGYVFGDNGPVELIWKKSLNYKYGLARSYFRLYPLQFLDMGWGETYTRTGNNLRVERNLQTSLSSTNFLMHGEKLNIINSYTPAETLLRVITSGGTITSSVSDAIVKFVVTHTANTGAVGPMGAMGPSSTVLSTYVNDTFIGLIYEGVPFTFSSQGVSFTNIVIDDLGIPYEMSDTITMIFSPSITYSFEPGQTKIFNGVGQWFTNLLRFTYIDADVSTAALAYRGWSVNLIHRLATLVQPDTITINAAQGDLPNTGYNVILKRATNTADLWITGLRVQLVQMGTKTVTPGGLYVPVGSGADWIFRINGYNSKNPQINYYQFDTSPSGAFTDFYALGQNNSQISWNKYLSKTSTLTTTLPLQITGIQNVINFLYGYIDFLQDSGFKINANDVPIIDQLTGRNLDWQLEVEKFIDIVYAGMQAGGAYVLNPFMNALYLQTPIGLMGRYTTSSFIDVTSTQACYDVTGSAIPIRNLSVIRTDDQTVTYSSTPIFSAHMFIDQFEHAVKFNNNFSSDASSATIFDPFLGEYINTAYMSFTRQDTIDGKPTFDGFVLNGNNITRNMVSSVETISNYYDAGKTFNNPVTAEHAMTLLGFKTKSYFDDLNITPTTQLDFWRGMIRAKGTNLAVDAFTQYKAFSQSSIDEFWAYKLATYGDSRERTSPEVKINPSDCAQSFTQFQFYSKDDSTYTAIPLYIQVEKNDDTRWYSIDDLGTTLRFDAEPISEIVTVTAASTLAPVYVTLKNIYHNGDTHAPTVTPSGATIITAQMIKVTAPGTYTISGYTWHNPTKFSPVKLFDYTQNVMDEQIALWHPAIGIHSYEALETINMITPGDPARYNYSTNTTNNENYLALKPWSDREIGRVWWDTSNLAYVPYYDAAIFPDRQTRHARWGSLTDWASVDLYVWTKSSYHPSEYNKQAALQAGDSTIDPSARLSGTVGFTNTYSANRIITIRPIAWSQAGVGNGNAHPAFGPSHFTKLWVANNNIIADTGRLVDIDVVFGRNIGGWYINPSTLAQKPVSEAVIGSSISYDIGTSSAPGSSALAYGSHLTSLSISNITNSSIFGTKIGQIKLLTNTVDTNVYLRMIDSTGFYQDILLSDWASTLIPNSMIFTFDQFGLQLTATTTATSISVTALAADLTVSNDIFVRECVNYTDLIELDTGLTSFFSNNSSDSAEYGWKTWVIPSQAQLSSDLVPPNNMWLPYLGSPVTINVNANVAAEMANSNNVWILPSGITVKRYSSSWSPWVQLTNISKNAISDGVNQVSITLTGTTSIDNNRLSVYSNGIQINPLGYSISNNVITVIGILPEGTSVRVLYRTYQPTSTDLAFNPVTKDNPIVQTWYKLDYEYTQVVERSKVGAITGTSYYFWVTGKTDPISTQSMSLVSAVDNLKYGKSSYMIFSRIVSDSNATSGAGYDSCAIFGLNNNVTKTNAFKLRFMRDFTLRSDPEQLKLKNVHTEWTLIRQNQSSKIPLQLWAVTTDAACGSDVGGNTLPSQVRIDYDNKYKTSTRYGFATGQIFAPTELVIESIINTILNTSITITIGTQTISDYITVLNINSSTTVKSLTDEWFNTPAKIRSTMAMIWSTARPKQINEIFFNILNDALANNYQMTDIFKTSLITLNSSLIVQPQTQTEQINEFY